MRVGIIGAGNVGTGLGRHLAAKGHDILVSFARTPEKLQEAAGNIGRGARPGSPEEAARHGEVVIIATPWAVTLDAVRQVACELAGKVVWDTTNPLKPDMSGLELGTTISAGEAVAEVVPRAKVVKAIAPFAEVLHSPSNRIGGRQLSVLSRIDWFST